MSTTHFEDLVNQHKDSVYRQMARVCGNREDAEDALATAIMQAFQAFERLGSDDAFRAWLGTIGKRVCYRMRSHAGITKALEFAEEHDLVAPNVDEMELTILKGCVKDAVEALNESYRDVYLMCEIEERTVEEVAAALGLTVAAAKSRLLRARAKVREMLDNSICAT
jgi:RNA polymerase sigma-70 factor (ECF subfamily)